LTLKRCAAERSAGVWLRQVQNTAPPRKPRGGHAPEEASRHVSNDLFFNGPNAVEADNRSADADGEAVCAVALRGGSSVVHADQEPYADVGTGLMTPGTGSDRQDRHPDAGIVKDLVTRWCRIRRYANSIPGTTTRTRKNYEAEKAQRFVRRALACD
jgi:hypothetical protein